LSRQNNFDSVRVLAAAAVIYGHAHPLTGTPDLIFLGNSIQSFAVKVFFIVSGFLVARSWAYDPHPSRYIAKRGLRIFPALLLCLALTILVLGPSMTTLPVGEYLANRWTWMYGFYNAVLYPAYSLPGVFAGNVYPHAVNGSLWSLPVEFLMYLVFPLVYSFSRLGRSNGLLVAFAIAFCAASLYWVRVAPPAGPIVWYGTGLLSVLDTGPYFFLGALFSMTRLQRILDPGVALFVVGVVVFAHPASAVASEVALYLAAPYCVLSFATAESPVLRRAGRFGDPSYGIYLYGFPVQQVASQLWPAASALQNTLVAMPVAVALAYGSWYLVERRALAIKPRAGKAVPANGLPSTEAA
jgi:peptidoglycan/LPS O-acetylase OafA/YrhL